MSDGQGEGPGSGGADFPPSIGASLDQMADMATGRRHIHLGRSPLRALMIYNLLLGLIATSFRIWQHCR
jgi:cytochrome b